MEEPGAAAPGGSPLEREGEGAGCGEEPARRDDDDDAREVDPSRYGGEGERAVRLEAERRPEREPDEEPRSPPRVEEGNKPATGPGTGQEPSIQKDPECAARGSGESEWERDPVERRGHPYRPASRFEERKRKISSPASSR